MPYFTVFTPTYNRGYTLYRLYESLKSQRTIDFEWMIVDDGSTDMSGAICDRYTTLDARIKVIHKQNEGLGFARNTGLEVAQGKFVTFIDSDDMFIDIYSLETLLKNIKNNDIICGNVYYENYDNTIVTISNDFSFQLHGKLYKRKYVDENKFQFNDSRNGEDNCFNRLLKKQYGRGSYIM